VDALHDDTYDTTAHFIMTGTSGENAKTQAILGVCFFLDLVLCLVLDVLSVVWLLVVRAGGLGAPWGVCAVLVENDFFSKRVRNKDGLSAYDLALRQANKDAMALLDPVL